MKIDTFIQLVSDLRKGQLETDEDPSNTVIQMYTNPFDTMYNTESVRLIQGTPSSKVWGDGTTYVATDAQGTTWNAPSCGWLWGSNGRWT
jgi:hypothetical protein